MMKEMQGYEFFLNKKVVIRKIDNWKLYGVLIHFDENFLFLKLNDSNVRAISKSTIADITLDKKGDLNE